VFGNTLNNVQDILPSFVVAGPPSCKEPRVTIQPISVEPTNEQCEAVSCVGLFNSIGNPMLGLCHQMDKWGDIDTILVSCKSLNYTLPWFQQI